MAWEALELEGAPLTNLRSGHCHEHTPYPQQQAVSPGRIKHQDNTGATAAIASVNLIAGAAQGDLKQTFSGTFYKMKSMNLTAAQDLSQRHNRDARYEHHEDGAPGAARLQLGQDPLRQALEGPLSGNLVFSRRGRPPGRRGERRWIKCRDGFCSKMGYLRTREACVMCSVRRRAHAGTYGSQYRTLCCTFPAFTS